MSSKVNPAIRTPDGFRWVSAVMQLADNHGNVHEVMDFLGDHLESSDAQVGLNCTEGTIEPGQFVVRYLDGSISLHDTDPSIKPEQKWSWGWATEDEPAMQAEFYADRESANSIAKEYADMTIAPTVLFCRNTYRWDNCTMELDWARDE